MEIVWSDRADAILSRGKSLAGIGVRNWALTREQALSALQEFEKARIPVLGGDVLKVGNAQPEHNYDGWHTDRTKDESKGAFLNRSLAAARDYIERYRASTPDSIVLFALVPLVD